MQSSNRGGQASCNGAIEGKRTMQLPELKVANVLHVSFRERVIPMSLQKIFMLEIVKALWLVFRHMFMPRVTFEYPKVKKELPDMHRGALCLFPLKMAPPVRARNESHRRIFLIGVIKRNPRGDSSRWG